MTSGRIIGIAVILVLLVGPLALWLAGRFKGRPATPASGSAAPWDWKLTVTSTLLYVLAFNLTFFIQELFLVLPKAFTPGLQPTLVHNNHSWSGDAPVASLFQGTGALATFVTGAASALLLRSGAGRSVTARLFLFWMAFSGVFMALPQVVVGALSEQSDLGMAMGYFGLGTSSKTAAALIACALIPLAGVWLGSLLLSQAAGLDRAGIAQGRRRFVFRTATLPGLLALAPIVLFRIPRHWIEVLAVPVVVTVAGLVWIQAGAWRARARPGGSNLEAGSVAWPLGAVLCLLLVFQIVLRPGIRFY